MSVKVNIDLFFEKAVKYVQTGLAKDQYPNKDELSNDQKLKFYALFKVATSGPNNTSRPGFFDFVGKAKWDAWTNESSKSRQRAKMDYINLLSKLAPGWEQFYDSVLIKKKN